MTFKTCSNTLFTDPAEELVDSVVQARKHLSNAVEIFFKNKLTKLADKNNAAVDFDLTVIQNEINKLRKIPSLKGLDLKQEKPYLSEPGKLFLASADDPIWNKSPTSIHANKYKKPKQSLSWRIFKVGVALTVGIPFIFILIGVICVAMGVGG